MASVFLICCHVFVLVAVGYAEVHHGNHAAAAPIDPTEIMETSRGNHGNTRQHHGNRQTSETGRNRGNGDTIEITERGKIHGDLDTMETMETSVRHGDQETPESRLEQEYMVYDAGRRGLFSHEEDDGHTEDTGAHYAQNYFDTEGAGGTVQNFERDRGNVRTRVNPKGSRIMDYDAEQDSSILDPEARESAVLEQPSHDSNILDADSGVLDQPLHDSSILDPEAHDAGVLDDQPSQDSTILDADARDSGVLDARDFGGVLDQSSQDASVLAVPARLAGRSSRRPTAVLPPPAAFYLAAAALPSHHLLRKHLVPKRTWAAARAAAAAAGYAQNAGDDDDRAQDDELSPGPGEGEGEEGSGPTPDTDPQGGLGYSQPPTTLVTRAPPSRDVERGLRAHDAAGEDLPAPTPGDVSTPRVTDVTDVPPRTRDVTHGEDGADFLPAVVDRLQAELEAAKTTQATTRSIINVLEERQEAQARDLTWLKDELKQLRTAQQADREVIGELRAEVADAKWGVADLKQDVQQIRDDISNMKQAAARHNDTVTANMRHLQRALASLRSDMATEQRTVTRQLLSVQEKLLTHAKVKGRGEDTLENEVVVDEGKGRGGRGRGRGRSRGRGGDRQGVTSGNVIHSVPVPGSSQEASGDGGSKGSREGAAGQFDIRSSAVEEARNQIGVDLAALRRREAALQQDVSAFERRFLHYDAELARVYTMFYNLSLSVERLENKVSSAPRLQQEDMLELQKSVINFTTHIIQLEQWQGRQGFLNGTSPRDTERELRQIHSLLENHAARLGNYEERIRDYRDINQQNYRLFMSYLERMNHTLQTSHHSFHDHKADASEVFADVGGQLGQLVSTVSRHDDRLLRVEVKVLNESLAQCQRGAQSDTTQLQEKLGQANHDIDALEDNIRGTDGKLHRLERTLDQVLAVQEKQGSVVSTVMEQLSGLWEFVPDVRALQTEVTRYMERLPQDCAAVYASTVYHPDGTYVIRPALSPASITVACQFSPRHEAWTIVQRRTDGQLLFSRGWDEYKQGFGDPNREYWIGLEALYLLTHQRKYSLGVDMWALDGTYYWAQYANFRVDSEQETNYRLSVSGYSGNATDALQYSNQQSFSTPDTDNDVSSTHCAKYYTAGWWYKHCHYGNLNGRYTVGVVWFNHDLDEWIQLRTTVMKIKPAEEGDDINRTTGRG